MGSTVWLKAFNNTWTYIFIHWYSSCLVEIFTPKPWLSLSRPTNHASKFSRTLEPSHLMTLSAIKPGAGLRWFPADSHWPILIHSSPKNPSYFNNDINICSWNRTSFIVFSHFHQGARLRWFQKAEEIDFIDLQEIKGGRCHIPGYTSSAYTECSNRAGTTLMIKIRITFSR